ncbi:FecR family protein [Sphingobacterium sp. BIGb0165]|uniref:FecR family protein n=1 Tax=Sphingobacterium sp. BIGb0165 TaxID=2940615 RepID=UPI002166CD6D|nr:FecR domain-containing protein [Sphingobacterium sp. BIGb0165]MCS4226987.1 ferric-dicitrate binding protein FerR (iron transport regulator) [Sphingobacterium sp. BIGb0165]
MNSSDLEQLLIRYESGRCTPEEELWIENWFRENDVHVNQNWNGLSAEQKQQYLAALFEDIEQKITPERVSHVAKPKHTIIKWVAIFVAAASILFFFLTDHFQASKFWSRENPVKITWSSVEASTGTQKQITLKDGTQIWLKGGTKLFYPSDFSERPTRNVRLEGEGYFEVTSDPGKPFIVETEGLEARVVGTSFNVEAYPELKTERINLIEGKLSVRKNKDKSDNEILIKASESIVLDDRAGNLSVTTMSVDQLLLDYKSGILNFNNTVLSEVLFRISKAYGILIEIKSEQALKRRITGTFEVSEPIEDVLQSIAESIGAQIKWKDGKVLELVIE